MDYIKDTLTEEEFLKKVFEKSKSNDSVRNVKSSLSIFNYFTLDKFNRTREQVLSDLMAEYKKNRDTKKPLNLLNLYKVWLGEDHPNITTKSGKTGKRTKKAVRGASKTPYLSNVKMWFRLCGNVKIDNDDYRDLVAVKNSELEDETEADPVNREELKEILTWVKDPIRRAKFLFMKCTAARHKETLLIEKRDIDLTVNPPIVTLRKSITKGKAFKRPVFLDSEAAKAVKNIVKDLDDNDFVFRNKNSKISLHKLRVNENKFWYRLMDKIAKNSEFKEINKKGENGHLLKRIHSIRSFAMKCIETGNSSGELGDAYGGHKKYVGKYLDKNDDEKIAIFQKAIPHMILFSQIETVDNEEIKEQYENQMEQMQKTIHYLFNTVEIMKTELGIMNKNNEILKSQIRD